MPDVGVYLPQVGFGWADILERARAAEEAGLHSLWLYDHLYAPGLPGQPSFEAWTLATWLLAHTESLRVGHLVLCAAFRHPALLAKMAATLDVCSGGRLELGLGSGSVEQEHRQMGLPWGSLAERTERLEEYLGVVRAMLTPSEGEPEATTFVGRHYQVSALPNLPAPLQLPRLPLHVGGVAPATVALAARHADVWNLPTYGLGRWRQHLLEVDRACEAAGREPSTLRRSVEAVLVLGRDDRSVAEALTTAERRYGAPLWGLHAGGFIGTPAAVAERIHEMAAAGVSHFIFLTHDRAAPQTLFLLAEKVLPALS